MRKILAVYDVDPIYADRFVEYLSQKERIPFELVAFTTMERLKAYLQNHHVELLLLGSASVPAQLEAYSIGQIVLLTEGETVSAYGDYPAVYKFQSSESVIREVMNYYTTKAPEEGEGVRSRMIGIYSPVARCLKTSLALAMGQLLSRQEPVLYVNLEVYAGFEGLFGEQYTKSLSDVLYFYKQGGEKGVRLEEVVRNTGGLSYIPPVRFPEDLEALNVSEIADFLRVLAKSSGYTTIIVDVGGALKTPIAVLEVCHGIYMPVKEDGVSASKLEAFDAHLEYLGKGELKDRIQRLKLPFHMSFGRKENYVEQLIWGELGDYVRSLLKGPLWMNARRF